MVDDWPAEAAEQTTATDHRPARPLFGMETELVGSLASKWSAFELEIGREGSRTVAPRNPVQTREIRFEIIAEGSDRAGRARVGLVNRAVDLAITPTR
jgi:hypothetical protein